MSSLNVHTVPHNDAHVVCDRVLHPGDILNGKVMLNIDHRSEVQHVVLHVRGYEKTEWVTSGGAIHTGQHDFFNANIPMGETGKLGSGQIELPFSMRLPDVIPGSCELGINPHFLSEENKKKQRVWACCKYKVEAVVSYKEPWAFAKEMRCAQVFEILNRPHPAYGEESTCTVTARKGGVLKKGAVRMTIKAQQNGFKRGDPIAVTINIDNKSTLIMQKRRYELVSVVELRSNKGKTYKSRQVLARVEQPNCPGMTEMQSRTNVQVQNWRDMAAVNSCYGGLMKCYYLLILEGQLGLKHPRAEVPILLYENSPVTAMPQIANWDPAIMPRQLVFTIPTYDAGLMESWKKGTAGAVEDRMPEGQTAVDREWEQDRLMPLDVPTVQKEEWEVEDVARELAPGTSYPKPNDARRSRIPFDDCEVFSVHTIKRVEKQRGWFAPCCAPAERRSETELVL